MHATAETTTDYGPVIWTGLQRHNIPVRELPKLLARWANELAGNTRGEADWATPVFDAAFAEGLAYRGFDLATVMSDDELLAAIHHLAERVGLWSGRDAGTCAVFAASDHEVEVYAADIYDDYEGPTATTGYCPAFGDPDDVTTEFEQDAYGQLTCTECGGQFR